MKIKNFKSGFTLIELLMVVAIIGVLTTIVLVSLNNARSKGGDAGVKLNLKNALSQAEIFFNTNTASPNTYTNVCTNGVVGGALGIGSFVLDASRDAGLSTYATNAIGTLNTATCNQSANAWAVEVPLRSVTGMWCIDNSGNSKFETTSSLSSAVDYTCI